MDVQASGHHTIKESKMLTRTDFIQHLNDSQQDVNVAIWSNSLKRFQENLLIWHIAMHTRLTCFETQPQQITGQSQYKCCFLCCVSISLNTSWPYYTWLVTFTRDLRWILIPEVAIAESAAKVHVLMANPYQLIRCGLSSMIITDDCYFFFMRHLFALKLPGVIN